MHPAKVVLLAVMFAAPSYVGFSMARGVQKRVNSMKEMDGWIRRLRSMMIHRGYTVLQALEAMAEAEPAACGDLAVRMLASLRVGEGAFQEIWVETVEGQVSVLGLLAGDMESFVTLGVGLLEGDHQELVRVFQDVMDELGERTKEVQGQAKVKAKMYRNIGVLMGAACVILMI